MSTFKFQEQFGLASPQSFTRTNEDDFITSGINFPKLVKHIKENNHFYFSYKDFLVTKQKSGISSVGIPISSPRLFDTPLFLKNELGEQVKINIKGKLNTREGQLDIRQNKVRFGFDLNSRKRKIEFITRIKYFFNNENAIEFSTFSYEHFLALSNELIIAQSPEIENTIINAFDKAFRNSGKDTSLLKWLYQKAPNFVIKQRADELLLEDLKTLIQYDKDSWFKDASSAILNLILGLNDFKIVYTYFNKNPNELIKIYDVLNANTQQELLVLLNSLCYAYTSKERKTSSEFTIGKDFSLNSNIFLKKGQRKILVENFEKKIKGHITSQDSFNPGLTKTTAIVKNEKIAQKDTFHPLDMVLLVNQQTGQVKPVCALNVKLISDKAEWDQVVEITTATITLVAVIASAGILAAGATGLVAAIAAAEIIVGIGDLAFLGLQNSEEGNWLIDNWPKISTAFGLVSIGSALRQGLLKNGPKILDKLRLVKEGKLLNVRKALLTAMLTINLEFEIAKFGKTTFKIVPFNKVVFKTTIFTTATVNRLWRLGIVIAKAETEDFYVLIYKGQKVAEGTIKELKTFVTKKLFKYGTKNDEVLKQLDEIVELNSVDNLRKIALQKYINKFDSNLFNHISGDVAVEAIKIIFREVSYVGTLGQGGHWVNEFLEIIRITYPPEISRLIDLLDDIPFKAKVKIKSLKGKVFPKQAESSMFPKNWDKQRIKEEIAYVYENTFIKGMGKIPRQSNDKFDKYEGLTTNNFKIRIEVNDINEIVNSYPIIN